MTDLSHGRLHGADPGALTGATDLDLSYNGLTALPEWVARLRGLVRLDLSYNELTSLPAWLEQLTELTTLKLDGNPLPGVPEHLPPGVRIVDLNEGRSAW